MTAASEWPLRWVDQGSLFFQCSLVFKRVNYSTKAQRSPLLTFVLLISFFWVTFHLLHFTWGERRQCEYIVTHPDSCVSSPRQAHSVGVCPEREAGRRRHIWDPVVSRWLWQHCKTALLKGGPVTNKIFKTVILSSNISSLPPTEPRLCPSVV